MTIRLSKQRQSTTHEPFQLFTRSSTSFALRTAPMQLQVDDTQYNASLSGLFRKLTADLMQDANACHQAPPEHP